MSMTIENIWEIFKKEKVEKQYAFYENNNKPFGIKISKDETKEYGSLDTHYLFSLMKDWKERKITIVHNHITTDAKPSFPDFYQFNYFQSLFRLAHIYFDDYIIVSPFGYFSFKENNLMENQSFPHSSPEIFHLEPIKLKNVNDVLMEEKRVLSFLDEYNEVIVCDELTIGSFKGFDSSFLIEYLSRFSLDGKCFIFYRYNGEDMTRLKDLCEIIRPVECFIVKNGKFHPAKRNGFI